MRQIVIALTIAIIIFSNFSAAQSKIETNLEQKLTTGEVHEKLPIVVLYEGMPSFAEVAREYRFLGEEEVIREQVVRVMKENAESLHYWLKQMCESPSMAKQVEGFTSIWVVNAVSLKATPAAIREIALQPNVAKVLYDEPVPMLFNEKEMTWGVKKINAPSAWQYSEGKGIAVAVIDTGINEHGDLKGRVIDGKNYINPGTPPRDDHGHGTHCAGTVAGNGYNGLQTGVAPQATVISIKVLGANGSGAWSNLYLAIEESIETSAKVISMSLGGFPNQEIRDRLRLACKNAIAAGVIPVIAAGNSGNKGIAAPGDVPEVITVAATDSGDRIAYFSGRGPTTWDGQEIVKPDIAAPGVSIQSCSHTSEGYTSKSGTSMATPHVAGLVALMCGTKSNLNTEVTKQILERTADDLGQKGKDNSYGSGRVDALKTLTTTKSLQATADSRFEMVVKEMAFETTIDENGNLYIKKTIENDLLPATVTVWVNVDETFAQKGVYNVNFTLEGPNGSKSGTVSINYDNIPGNSDQYDEKYGFNVGNFEMVQGQYTGTVESIAPNSQVKSAQITIRGKATWPARESK